MRRAIIVAGLGVLALGAVVTAVDAAGGDDAVSRIDVAACAESIHRAHRMSADSPPSPPVPGGAATRCGLDAPVTTAPPVTDPPTTDPPATDPPTTGPPATDPPATDPPTTDPPASSSTLPPVDPGFITVDHESASYDDDRTSERYFFFDPDDFDDPTWGPTRIGWLVECDSMPDLFRAHIDPIVFPGVASHHEHEFFGNGNVTSTSTTQSFVDTPRDDIACTDVNDKSAYWSPVVYQDGVPVRAELFKAYYKSTTPETVPMPLGLRIVAGNAHATENQDSVVGWFEEQRTNDLTPREDLTNTIGATEMITRQNDSVNMVLRINFPNCWDGVHLDSPDHQSHMAYFDEETLTCPATHPVKIPQLTTFTNYDVEGGEGFSLSSGEWFTFHQDFWNAWSPDQMAELNERCILAELNCRITGSQRLKNLGQYSAFVPELDGET